MNVLDFEKMKKEGHKISMVTTYDFWTARLINETSIDVALVGDSLAMVMHGHPSTLTATVEMMRLHTEAVVRGAPKKFIVSDMPFLSYRKGLKDAMDAVGSLMSTGAHAVKLEGVDGHEDIIKNIVQSGVPVMGHLGLTPQSVHQLGGFKVQGRTERAAQAIKAQAQKLQDLGCFSVVLECVPSQVAKEISEELQIPTIGIGAGIEVDGQVLVLQDMLGSWKEFTPKFVRHFGNTGEDIISALKKYDESVKNKQFPSLEESYK